MPRLLSSDLAVLGVYLFGPRWQSALARALHCSDRLVRQWVAGQPVSPAYSRRIEGLVRARHGEPMRRTRAVYLGMIESLSETAIKGRLLTMDLTELRVDNQLRQTVALMRSDVVLAMVGSALTNTEQCTVPTCPLRDLRAPPPSRQ